MTRIAYIETPAESPSRRLCERAERTCVAAWLCVPLLLVCSPVDGAPPDGLSLPQAVALLADEGQGFSIDNLEELTAWQMRLSGSADEALPVADADFRRGLVRFLARQAPIVQGPGLIFPSDVTLLERLQVAVLPTVAAMGDAAFLPVLRQQFQAQIDKGRWRLAEEYRLIIRTLNGDAPSRPITEGPVYYCWLKDGGYYRTIQNLVTEPDLEEQTPASRTPLYEPFAGPGDPAIAYDEARVRRILEALDDVLPSDFLNGNLERWFQFGGGRSDEFRLCWAIDGVRFYLRGYGDQPRTLILLLDEPLADAAALQTRLASLLTIGDLEVEAVHSATSDGRVRATDARIQVGLRDYRQGRFTAVRVDR